MLGWTVCASVVRGTLKAADLPAWCTLQEADARPAHHGAAQAQGGQDRKGEDTRLRGGSCAVVAARASRLLGSSSYRSPAAAAAAAGDGAGRKGRDAGGEEDPEKAGGGESQVAVLIHCCSCSGAHATRPSDAGVCHAPRRQSPISGSSHRGTAAETTAVSRHTAPSSVCVCNGRTAPSPLPTL